MGCFATKQIDNTSENLRFVQEATATKPKTEPEFRTILLLGAGESGKSTIAKQIKIIYHGGFSAAEAARYKETIHQNIITSMKTLLEAAAVANHVAAEELHSEELRPHVLLIRSCNDREEITREMGEAIKVLWASKAVQAAWQVSNKLQVVESASYYFDQIERISSEVYFPTHSDILRSRAKTTGITELFFEADNKKYKLIDVGGQRSERRKWLNTYAVDEGISAIIYCVSMSSFDQQLAEDLRFNRMEEEIELFKQTSNSTWFRDVPTLLMLNKADLFRTKIQKVDLKEKLPDYQGHGEFDEATRFLVNKFSAMKKGQMTTLVTCAMDSEDIVKAVKEATRMSQMKRSMRSSNTALGNRLA